MIRKHLRLPLLLLAAATAAPRAIATSPWTMTFDAATGAITSLSNGATELADEITAAANLPALWLGAGAGGAYFETVLDAPCASVGGDAWSCVGTVALPAAGGAPAACRGSAGLRVQYDVALVASATPAAAAVLAQNVTLSPLVAGCAPGDFLAVALPRAATLAGEAARSGGALTRRLSTHLISGEPYDAPSATSGDFNGLVFVSAGAYWLPPNKGAPEFPGYLLSVPAMDEYLVSGSGGGAAPVVLTTACDPYALTNFELGYALNQSRFAWAWNCSDADVGCFVGESSPRRSFFTAIAESGDNSVDARMQRLYATALAHIPAAPAWTKGVAMTDYDYFSPLPPSPNGFEADMHALAAKIPPAARGTVAVCIHGWYGLIGQYTLASPNGTALLDSWTVFPDGAAYMNAVTKQPVGPIPMSKAGVHQRIDKARALGFRVLLYFSDGVNSCEGVPFWREQVELTTYTRGEWKGPDSTGRLFARNPLHAATVLEVTNLARGIMDEYGASIDGLVWDETFEMVNDQAGVAGSAPGYAGLGMLRLVEAVAGIVHSSAACRECVLLVAGCMQQTSMPSALVADGTYEDVGLNTAAAPYGVLPNYRNALWECGWDDVSHSQNEGAFVRFNVPVGISNGWGDFVGFANMTTSQQDYFVALALNNHSAASGPRFP